MELFAAEPRPAASDHAYWTRSLSRKNAVVRSWISTSESAATGVAIYHSLRDTLVTHAAGSP